MVARPVAPAVLVALAHAQEPGACGPWAVLGPARSEPAARTPPTAPRQEVARTGAARPVREGLLAVVVQGWAAQVVVPAAGGAAGPVPGAHVADELAAKSSRRRRRPPTRRRTRPSPKAR
ncbi:MAG TPA: hypothetical protein VME46_10710 [Acidimicrobiales bacterium]|nr:hypothetical protein [Acidimicrobiales bacterium]